MFDATSVYPAWMKPACAAALLGVVLGFTVFAFFLPGYAGLAVSIASMGGLMTAVAVAALQTGRVKVDSSASDYGGGTTTVAYRERDPFGFWSSVVLYGVLAALCYGVAVFVLLA